MKNLGITLSIIISISFFGNAQNNLSKRLQSKNMKNIDCQNISFNSLELIANKLKQNEMDSVEIVTNEWISLCDTTELSERLLIICHLLKKENTNDLIKHYVTNIHSIRLFEYSLEYQDLHIKNNIYSSLQWMPIILQINSLLMLKANDLLETHTLSHDEQLICTLFSGDIKLFKKLQKKEEYHQTITSKNYVKQEITEFDEFSFFTIYVGSYQALNSTKIIGVNPTIGLSFHSPLKHKLIAEIKPQFRIHINDNDFEYYALEDTHTVNSNYAFSINGLIGYQLHEINEIKFIPKLGVGLEIVDTGITEQKEDEEIEYYNIKTMHFSISLAMMKRVFIKHYAGIEIGYHYCPYELDKDLISKFDNNALSLELFFML